MSHASHGTGIIEVKFSYEGHEFRLVDVGGFARKIVFHIHHLTSPDREVSVGSGSIALKIAQLLCSVWP